MTTTAPATAPRRTPLASQLLQGALTLLVVYLVFFKVMPNIADWSAVRDVLPEISAGEFTAIILLGVALECIKATEQLILIPVLRFIRAFVSLETTTVVSNLIPGPSGTAMRFVVYRSWGISSADFAKGWIVSSAFNNLMVLLLPVVGVILVAFRSDVNVGPRVITAAVIGLVLAGVAVGVGIGILSHERFARRVGTIAGVVLRKLRGLRKKPDGADAVESVLRFRTDTIDALHQQGLRLGVTIFTKFALTAFLLWFALRAVGVSSDALNASEVLASYAFVRLLTIVDITPGSVGVAEALYAASLGYLANGKADDATIVAGVLLFRTATYVLPIVLGAGCYVTWRLKRSWRVPAPVVASHDAVIAAAVDLEVEQ